MSTVDALFNVEAISPEYIRKQVAIALDTQVSQSTADDAMWRIASHLEGAVDGLESIGQTLTQDQVNAVRGYLMAHDYIPFEL